MYGLLLLYTPILTPLLILIYVRQYHYERSNTSVTILPTDCNNRANAHMGIAMIKGKLILGSYTISTLSGLSGLTIHHALILNSLNPNTYNVLLF